MEITQTNGATRHWPREGVTRIPYWVYQDPAIYDLEQERIFGGAGWNYVGLEAEVPNPGDFRRSHVGDKPVVVTRHKDGGINVVANRCAHRGVQFCRTNFGNTTAFTCPYHQWTYAFFGYADDSAEMIQRRLRQANLMGPAGLVSIDDNEAMQLSQQGVVQDRNDRALLELGGAQSRLARRAGLRAYHPGQSAQHRDGFADVAGKLEAAPPPVGFEPRLRYQPGQGWLDGPR